MAICHKSHKTNVFSGGCLTPAYHSRNADVIKNGLPRNQNAGFLAQIFWREYVGIEPT